MMEMPTMSARQRAFQRWHVITEIDLMRFVAEHADLARLCTALEHLSVDLPRLAPEVIGKLCGQLERLVVVHGASKQARLAALLGSGADPMTSALLERTAANHALCADLARDLIAALTAGPDEDVGVTVETLGCMLQGFNHNCRQAIAFEELVILHLGDDRLTADARELLTDSMVALCTF